MLKITTLEMEEALARYFGYRQNIIVPNISFGFNIHECDLLILRKSGHVLEVEIKISRSDLKKDLKKEHCHSDYFNRIKELWFAIPEYLQDSQDLVPEQAGIIVVYLSEWGGFYCRTIRDPEVNTSAHKLDATEQLALARLGTMRIWNLKRKILDMKKPRKRRIARDKFQYNLQFADANIT